MENISPEVLEVARAIDKLKTRIPDPNSLQIAKWLEVCKESEGK